MSNKNFTLTVDLVVTPQNVYDAINNVRGWWSENIEGDTTTLNSEFTYHYQDVHICKIKITELDSNKKVVWHVLDNHFNFTKDRNEWKGTDIIFEITEKEGITQLRFTHKGLTPEDECYNVCHDAWTHYVKDSLKQLILTGSGCPTPKDTTDAVAGETEKRAQGHRAMSIHHRLLIEKPAEIVYEALTAQKGLAGWWTPEVTAAPEIGSTLSFNFGPDYHKEMKVEALQPYSFVKWRTLKAFEEWINTTVSFELQPHAKGTILVFHHEGWKTYSDEFASCSYDWALFLRSLKLLCETQKGKPYPDYNK